MMGVRLEEKWVKQRDIEEEGWRDGQQIEGDCRYPVSAPGLEFIE